MSLEKEKKRKENKKEKSFLNKIPIAAIIFPPIGFIMLINYLLKKNKKEN
jgi:mannose/fructose/N-acetylgalactosamine-specific phosphotransferase system component IIC